MTAFLPIIAIDGPAGSGKSTVAKLIAKKLGLFYIDTGAMYRALALKAKNTKIDPGDSDGIIKLAKALNVKLDYDAKTGQLKVSLDDKDVSEAIRRPEITEHVSVIAKIKEVRDCMVRLQRKLAQGKKAILEGRDITTVVFPDAYKKFYLDADPQERIKRRYLELKNKDHPIEETAVKKDIEHRDHLDTTRKYAPLKRAKDAVFVDTTHLSIDEVVNKLIREIEKP
jgi:cytidylate kinase